MSSLPAPSTLPRASPSRLPPRRRPPHPLTFPPAAPSPAPAPGAAPLLPPQPAVTPPGPYATHLFSNILKEPLFWTNPQEAIKNAYHSTNKYILENAKQLGPGGSTAVTAIVVDGKDMWIANIGDSRAVLCERGAANQLTVDHEPNTFNERETIEKQGGLVTTFPGDVPRVNGQLAVARAFGDQSLKAHLSSEPDVRHAPINSTMEFVILASDGLWKVMKNQEAVDIVKSIKDPQAAAKRLTTEALSRKSKDDISCIVIRFRC